MRTTELLSSLWVTGSYCRGRNAGRVAVPVGFDIYRLMWTSSADVDHESRREELYLLHYR